MANQFYECNFPFQFKDYFLIWESTHQFEVKVQILQLLAQTTFKKKLDVEFDKVSNAKKTRVKKIFIEGIEQPIQNRCIQSKFHIVQKDNSVKYINQLRPYHFQTSSIRNLQTIDPESSFFFN